jgi:replicative DNA helicase
MEQNKETTVAVNNLLDVRSKFNSKDLIDNITSEILTGNIPALEGMTILKRMSKISEEVMKNEDIKKMAMTELEKYSAELKGAKKSVELYSASMSISATYIFYKFDNCGHEVLNQLYKIQEHCKEIIKQIEEEVKTIPPLSDKVNIEEFGIKQDGRDMLFSQMPKLIWEEYGGMGNVKAPQKIQTIGIRYNKV